MTPEAVSALLDLLHADLLRCDALLDHVRPQLAADVAELDDAQLDQADEVAAATGGWLLKLHERHVAPSLADGLFDPRVFSRWCDFLSAVSELGELHEDWEALGIRANAVQLLATEQHELCVLGVVGEIAEAELEMRRARRSE